MNKHLLILLFAVSLISRELRLDDVAPPEPRIGITPDLTNQFATEARGRNPVFEAPAARTEAASEAVDSISKWDSQSLNPCKAFNGSFFNTRTAC
jgi:hypothetical protein